jgi:hypothetical protein
MTDSSRNPTADALDRIDRAERRYKQAFLAAIAVEAAALPVYLALADFSNRTHVLLLLASVATYTIIAIGLVALGVHVNRSTLRILRAVEMASAGRWG